MVSKKIRIESCNGARRRLWQVGLAAPALWVAGGVARATTAPGIAGTAQPARMLRLVNTHTGESLVTQYFAADRYLPDALQRMGHLLRDHRSGESHAMDPALFDQLHQLATLAGSEPEFEIISGYRSPASNAQLNASSSGVAKNSLHMQGRAIDVRLRGVSCLRLRDLALTMNQGGVGYYPKSDFIHLDTGRLRSWSG